MNTIKYQDLPEDRKEQEREKYREHGLDYDWWDGVYDYAKETAGKFGLEIDDIFFSGFWSQGDGAFYTGRLIFKPCVVAELPEEVRDIYETLYEVHSLMKIAVPFFIWIVDISHVGRHSHGHTMQIATDISADIDDPIGGEGTALETIMKETEQDVAEALRDYALWIYRTLEKEYEFLTSDECIDDLLHSEEYENEQEIDG